MSKETAQQKEEKLQAMDKNQLIYMAKISEQTEMYEDMLQYMKALVKKNEDLTVEDRNLLSVAYKNSVGSRRTAWRALSSIEQKEEKKGSKHMSLLKDYKTKIEGELLTYCKDILSLLDSVLINNCKSDEARVFFHKMKGDYQRYIAEFATGDTHKSASDFAHEAYEKATEIAKEKLKTTHPIRLGLALNFSVFNYEVLNDPTKACNIAKEAFDEAIAEIEHIEEDQYKDATTIMQLIRDNLTLWTSELQDEGADNEIDGTHVENC